MNKIIYVYCGLDLHKEIIQTSIQTLKELRSDVDIGVATYGNKNLAPSTELEEMCKNLHIPFFDCPRQHYNNIDIIERSHNLNADVDSCEITGMIEVSTHFYKTYDYEMVILMHPDTLTIRNYRNSIESYINEDYCLVAPLINLDPNNVLPDKNILVSMDGFQIARTSLRITQAILSFGKKFCLHMDQKYKTAEEMWKKIFSKYNKFGDCSMVEFYPHFEGFKTHLLDGDLQIITQESFGHHNSYGMRYLDYVLKYKNLNFLHIGHPPAGWYPSQEMKGRYPKEKYMNTLISFVQYIRSIEMEEK
jgi:hypothetical protein